MDIKSCIRTVPDFPKPGILFRDITGLLETGDAFRETCQQLLERAGKYQYDKIAGLESRGFVFGAPLSILANKPLILVRKPGKLPGAVLSQAYDLEYGSAEINIHANAIAPGDRVLIVDDLLATGGTAQAAAKLVEKAGGTVAAILFVIELKDLPGRKRLEGYNLECLVDFEGD